MVGISLEFHVMNSPYDPIEHKGYPSRGQAPEIYATRLKTTPKVRTRGPAPLLNDAEVLTIEILAEIMGHGSDKGIFDYTHSHWR